MDRLSSSFQGLVAAIGGGDSIYNFINSLASGIQNQAMRIAGPPQQYVNALDVMDTGSRNFTGREELENFLEEKSGDNWLRKLTEKRAKEILQNFSIPEELANNEDAAYRYTSQAVRGFTESSFFDPEENGAAMAASFVAYIESSSFNEQAALALAIGGGKGLPRSYSEEPINYTPMEQQFTAIPELDENFGVVSLSAVNASYSIDAMASAAAGAAGAFSVFGGARIDIGDASVAQVTGQYQRDLLAGRRFADRYGIDSGIEEEDVMLFVAVSQ